MMILGTTATILAVSVLVGVLRFVLGTVLPTLVAAPQRDEPHMLHRGMVAVLAA